MIKKRLFVCVASVFVYMYITIDDPELQPSLLICQM